MNVSQNAGNDIFWELIFSKFPRVAYHQISLAAFTFTAQTFFPIYGPHERMLKSLDLDSIKRDLAASKLCKELSTKLTDLMPERVDELVRNNSLFHCRHSLIFLSGFSDS